MQNQEQDAFYLTLTLDDDTEVECEVIAKFPIGEKQYIALMPQEQLPGYEEDALFLYGCIDLPGDEVQLIQIEDEAEYAEVCEAFEAFMDEE